MTLMSLALVIFLIIDPLGSIKQFLRCLENVRPERRRIVIMREMFIALAFMIAFNYLGDHIFHLLQISDTTVYLASGVILFITAISILFPKPSAQTSTQLEGEPFLVPLAIPMIAGPAVLATIMLYSGTEPSPWAMLVAIFIAWSASAVILLCARPLIALVSLNGITACEKLSGMILVLLSVDRILQGVMSFFHHS